VAGYDKGEKGFFVSIKDRRNKGTMEWILEVIAKKSYVCLYRISSFSVVPATRGGDERVHP